MSGEHAGVPRLRRYDSPPAPPAPPSPARGTNLGDRVFAGVVTAFGGAVLAILGLIIVASSSLARPALAKLGFLAFLTGTDWNPVEDVFGALPFIYGTLVTATVAVALAVPVSVGLALFVTEMSGSAVRRVVTFLVELLAGIPSVVYGLWGLFVLVPWLRQSVEPALQRWFGGVPLLGALVAGPPIGIGLLAAGLLLAIMILPTIASVAVEVLRTTPAPLREGALALGATRWEAIRMAVLPYARRGLLGATILGLGRALGETMAVTMVIGNQPEIRASLLAPGYSLPSIIANEFAEATGAIHTGALAGLALVLLGVTLLLNASARLLVHLSSRPPAGRP